MLVFSSIHNLIRTERPFCCCTMLIDLLTYLLSVVVIMDHMPSVANLYVAHGLSYLGSQLLYEVVDLQ
jgi:hypothetical protein